MSLSDKLAGQIALSGPIGVAQFVRACLHDPDFGYYSTRPALGKTGDFITAPMVSQMFGEMIGLWVIGCWRQLGEPKRFVLAEAGPGDGGLFSDILRTVKWTPDCRAAADCWLVETSPPLRAIQQARLQGQASRWADHIEALPNDAPMILVANELLDCMGADQFVWTGTDWAERRVGLSAEGGLAFGLVPAPQLDFPAAAPPGAVLELSGQQAGFGAQLGEMLARQGGAALLIDYGRAEPEFGDTLQALKNHAKVDPLATAGEADLTQHADFPTVSRAAVEAGAQAWPVIPQAEFLTKMGIAERAEQLSKAWPDKAELIGRQLERLIAPDQMGDLFKALWLYADPAMELA